MSPPRMIKLKCSDDVVLDVGEDVAIRSGWIKGMIEDGYGDDAIPLIAVNSRFARLIFDFLKFHNNYLENETANDITLDILNNTKSEHVSFFDARIREEELKSWDALEELKRRKAELNVDNDTLFELIRAVDYLIIPELLDITRQSLFDRNLSKNEIPWDIRELFEIQEEVFKGEPVGIRVK